jgi:hypothetical protein
MDIERIAECALLVAIAFAILVLAIGFFDLAAMAIQ